MLKENLVTYAEIDNRDGDTILFRKFDTSTWMFQYNKEGELIGNVLVSNDVIKAIHNAPSIKTGDFTTIQQLK